MTHLIILRGYPGSGKTTVGKQLELAGAGTFIDHNAILTFLAGIAGDDEGIYDEIAQLELAICKKLLSEGRAVIVARGFSSLASMKAYEDTAADLNCVTMIVRLDVRQQELINRVQSPERQADFNPTTDKQHLLDWITANPLQDHPSEITIDNEAPLNQVISDITTLLAASPDHP